ncbi:MAG TPA: hypothetical protein VGB98_26610 [Pyrinomonadaceae bacterium]|jgi:hypothetical protein
MADNVQPDAGEQREESTSGLLISAEPLRGSATYKLGGDDSDSGKGGLLGDDSSDSDGSDALGGDDESGAGDSDASDAGDDDSDADGTDVSDADGNDTGLDADGMDPLGIAPGDADSSDASDAGGGPGPERIRPTIDGNDAGDSR